MYSKAKIFNLALGALLLQRQIVDPDTDKSNESKVLLTHWDTALIACLGDLDLDRTSSQITLELIEQNPNSLWQYSYKYPSNCAFFRRIQTYVTSDNRSTFIPRRIATKDGKTVIFTNQSEAIGEYIPSDVPLSSLSAPAGYAVAVRLALLSAPLIVGKGAKTLIQQLDAKYISAKAEAQRHDHLENFLMEDPEMESEFVEARTT